MSHRGPGRAVVFLRHSPCQHSLTGLPIELLVVETVILILGRRNRNAGLRDESVTDSIIMPRLFPSMEVKMQTQNHQQEEEKEIEGKKPTESVNKVVYP